MLQRYTNGSVGSVTWLGSSAILCPFSVHVCAYVCVPRYQFHCCSNCEVHMCVCVCVCMRALYY